MNINFVDITNNLRASLSQYGLNPNEWLLIQKQKNIFKIINAKDNNLLFLGEVQRTSKNLSWKRITLIGL